MIRNVAIDEMADDQPEEYMTFFSLRGWGKHKSGVLTTEQVYIHGKTCIIDDRECDLELLELVEILGTGADNQDWFFVDLPISTRGVSEVTEIQSCCL